MTKTTTPSKKTTCKSENEEPKKVEVTEARQRELENAAASYVRASYKNKCFVVFKESTLEHVDLEVICLENRVKIPYKVNLKAAH